MNGGYPAVGELVSYRGSLTGHHGTWVFTGSCGACCIWSDNPDEFPENRFVLRHPQTGQLLMHVHRSSIVRDGAA